MVAQGISPQLLEWKWESKAPEKLATSATSKAWSLAIPDPACLIISAPP